MSAATKWAFVDDLTQEAQAFADQFKTGKYPIEVEVFDPVRARTQILGGTCTPLGVLMDVDLSARVGELGTGPGIAQDIRVRQRAKRLAEFPIVRFSAREKVAENVLGDPTSSDLFDIKIGKEDLTKRLEDMQKLLRGLQDVYSKLSVKPSKPAIYAILGVTAEQFDAWGHESLIERLASGLRYATHVAAAALVGTVLVPPGLLVNEQILSFRLGVSMAESGAAWTQLKKELDSFVYRGAGAPHFSRWWAKGLDDWWWAKFPSAPPLSSLTIEERNEFLSTKFKKLRRLKMPKGSAGDRPWRHCSLTLESESGDWIPLDPSAAVRLTPWSDLAPWVDPQYATLAAALQEKDARANEDDVAQLWARYNQ